MVFMSVQQKPAHLLSGNWRSPAIATTAAVAAVGAALLTSGCGAIASGSESGEPEVVAAFYPYAYLAQRIAGDSATVTNLTPPGVEPHDVELSPQQVAQLAGADLVIYEANFQPAIDDALEQNPPGDAIDVTELVSLLPSEESSTAESDSPTDPHVWLDPTRLVPVTQSIVDALGEADPTHAEQYASNADRLVIDLKALDREFGVGLAACERTEFVTSHDAFRYLAARYGLTSIPIAGISPDIEPSPQHLGELQQLITEDGITTVFAETLGTKAYADTLANDLGLDSAVLDPIEGLSGDDAADNYFTLMRSNLAALRKANGCR